MSEEPTEPAIRFLSGGGFGANTVSVDGTTVTLHDGSSTMDPVIQSWDLEDVAFDTLGEIADAIEQSLTILGSVSVDNEFSPNAPSVLLVDQVVMWGAFSDPPLFADAS